MSKYTKEEFQPIFDDVMDLLDNPDDWTYEKKGWYFIECKKAPVGLSINVLKEYKLLSTRTLCFDDPSQINEERIPIEYYKPLYNKIVKVAKILYDREETEKIQAAQLIVGTQYPGKIVIEGNDAIAYIMGFRNEMGINEFRDHFMNEDALNKAICSYFGFDNTEQYIIFRKPSNVSSKLYILTKDEEIITFNMLNTNTESIKFYLRK